ncbi:MAG TPA: hypothetical protein VGL07_19385 [Buttiauxella sp.]|jgi:hypothetical protein
MTTAVSPQRRFGRKRRFVLTFLVILALTVGFFLMASLLFDADPDGHKVRDWLSASRYGLFLWRLSIYTGICWAWFYVVRPQVVMKSPGQSLHRLEWMTAGFIIVIEFVAWRSVLA